MHANQIVARVLKPCLSELHAKRAAALRRAVVAVLLGGALSVSSHLIASNRGQTTINYAISV